MDRESERALAAEWSQTIVGAEHDGSVRLRLSRDSPAGSVDVLVAPRGTHARALATTAAGDVFYQAPIGLSAREAASVADALAEQLDASPDALVAKFPHLLLDRTKPFDRDALQQRCRDATGLPVPAPRDRVTLDPEEMRAFLALDDASLGEHQLCAIEGDADGVILELQHAARISVLIRKRSSASEGFGGGGALAVEPRSELDASQARACSLLAARVALLDGGTLDVREPSSRASASADLAVLRYAIEASGYAIVRGVISPAALADLRAAADRALGAMRRAIESGGSLEYTFNDREVYLGSRCLYCWGEACERLLAHETIEQIGSAVLGRHRLFDMTAHSALPAAAHNRARTERWHRDIDVVDGAPSEPRYLWVMVCIDEFTADNGAIWVVPGSHRVPTAHNLSHTMPGERYLTRTQLLADAGDLIIVNPSALHTVGHNVTDRPRLMINVSLCRAEVRPLLDHWAIAGPVIQARAGERLRAVLGEERERPLDTTWSVLPEGWRTGVDDARCVRTFSEEQRESFQPSTLARRID